MHVIFLTACSGRVRIVAGLVFALLSLCLVSTSWAAWTPERLDAATEAMRQFRKDWTRADTEALIANGPDRAVSMAGSVSSGFIYGDNAGRIPVVITGDSILVNGRDISGNLGSKTTHGTNSPIIENVRDSQIATGQSSSATNSTTSNVTVNVTLSIALSFSVALNLYLLLRLRRRGTPPPSLGGADTA